MIPRSAAEDEGYLVTYLTHEVTGESKLAVFDAKTMDSTPLATVRIPHRVPAGDQLAPDVLKRTTQPALAGRCQQRPHLSPRAATRLWAMNRYRQ